MDINKETRSIKELATEFILGENNSDFLERIIEKVNTDKHNFSELITSLETFFVNSNDILRKNSSKLICLVIEKMTDIKLSSKELLELLDFSIKKLKDVVCVVHSIRSIYNLIIYYDNNRKDFPNMDINDNLILEKILYCLNIEYLHIPSYNQETRFFSYKIILYLVTNQNLVDKLNDKMEEMLKLILDSIESEKDPRNILIIFELITQVFKFYDKHPKFPLYVRNLFDILELYYPIEFSPPKNSPEEITAENLISLLNNAFSSSDTLAEAVTDMLREKISSTSIETKIEVLKTYRAINRGYSQDCLNLFWVNIVDNLLNEIFNNSDEFLHVEGLITFKDILERFSSSIKSKNSLSDNENHILKNIEKIFDKCEDLLFSDENIKSCYDAKDILVIICDFQTLYKERGLKISLKLISNYLNNGKFVYLRNASTILYFSLNNIQKNDSLLSFLDLNIKNIKNFVNSVLNKHHSQIDGLIASIEIATILPTSISVYFNKDEVKGIFERILSIWKEMKGNSEQETNINKCLNELIMKFHELNNSSEIIENVETNLSFIMNTDQAIDTHKINELIKNFALLQEYSLNVTNFKQVSHLFFKSFEKIFFYNKKPNKCCFQESLLKILTDNILYILDKSSKVEDLENFYYDYIYRFFNMTINHRIKSTIYKNFDKIFGKIIDKHFISPKSCLDIILKALENMNLKLNTNHTHLDQEEKIETVSLKKNGPKKCCDKVKKREIYVFELKTICKLLVNENITNYLLSLDNIEEKEYNSFKFYEDLLNYLDCLSSKNINDKGFSKYINELTGIIFYLNINSIKLTSNPKFNVIVESILANLNLYVNKYFSIKDTKFFSNNMIIQLDYISTLINFLIIIREEQFYKYLSIIFDFLLDFSDSKGDTLKASIIQTLPETNLFHFNKHILGQLMKENYKKMLGSFVEILEFLKKYIFRLEGIKLNSQISYRTTVILLSKYFKFVDSSIITNNSSMLLDIILKSLDSKVNIILSLNLLKKIMLHSQLKESKIVIKTLCENLLNILVETNDMNLKIDILWCLYQIKLNNNKFDASFTKRILKSIKPLLSDRKRLVRKYSGICNNIWTLSD